MMYAAYSVGNMGISHRWAPLLTDMVEKRAGLENDDAEENQASLKERIAEVRKEKVSREYVDFELEGRKLFVNYKIEERCLEAAYNGSDEVSILIDSLDYLSKGILKGDARFLNLANLIQREGLEVELELHDTIEVGRTRSKSRKCNICHKVDSRLSDDHYCRIIIFMPEEDS